MLILDRNTSDLDRESHIVALFGVGIVGRAIASSLISKGWRVVGEIAIPWDNESGLRQSLVNCHAALRELRNQRGDGVCSFVWSAGRAGFQSQSEETDRELQSFQEVLRLFGDLVPQLYTRSRWHHVSSAGGLFEGQRLVAATSHPNPQRPYGELKLRQEEALHALPETARAVYRLTSVFGPVRRGQRSGLIPTMARNGVLGRVTRIVGRSETLRDFTWNDDVATFLTDQVERPESISGQSFLMASGRPVSIREVQRQVELGLNRRLYMHYSEPQNSSDITFSESLVPREFRRTNLADCIRHVCRGCLANVALIA